MGDCKEWQAHRGTILDSKNGFDVIECHPCEFKHVVPIPTLDELDRYYENTFYADKGDYFQRHREELEWWNMVNGERYQRFEEFLPGGPGRILDIGSGPGFFLQLGKERGWEVLGLEPGKQAVEHARNLGVSVVHGSWSQGLPEHLGTFDVVHVGWAMEHLPDPRSFVETCYRLVRPHGLFCAVVANDYNPLQLILREHCGYDSWWLVPPEHLNYFSIPSLQRLLATCGFECVNVTTSFPLEFFLLMGENYVGNESIGRQCHSRRRSLEFALARSGHARLKADMYSALSRCNIGRDIEIIVRRPSLTGGATQEED